MTGHPTFDSRHDPEGNPTQFPAGWLGTACFAACALLAAYALTWTQISINTAIYRASFLGAVLSLLFLLMPAIAARPKRTGPLIEHAVAALAARQAKLFLQPVDALADGGFGQSHRSRCR